MNIEELLAEITDRCEGLTYVSETDAEVHAFSTDIRGNLNAANFLEAIDKSPLTAIQESNFDNLFVPQIEIDETGKWEILEVFLQDHLTNPIAFKIGETPLEIYAVGMFAGKAVGIKTSGVET